MRVHFKSALKSYRMQSLRSRQSSFNRNSVVLQLGNKARLEISAWYDLSFILRPTKKEVSLTAECMGMFTQVFSNMVMPSRPVALSTQAKLRHAYFTIFKPTREKKDIIFWILLYSFEEHE